MQFQKKENVIAAPKMQVAMPFCYTTASVFKEVDM